MGRTYGDCSSSSASGGQHKDYRQGGAMAVAVAAKVAGRQHRGTPEGLTNFWGLDHSGGVTLVVGDGGRR